MSADKRHEMAPKILELDQTAARSLSNRTAGLLPADGLVVGSVNDFLFALIVFSKELL